MNMPQAACHFAALLTMLVTLLRQPVSQPTKENTPRTRVVLLGTGTPVPDPDRSGPATAIVVGENAYLVDLGQGSCVALRPPSSKGASRHSSLRTSRSLLSRTCIPITPLVIRI